MSDYMNSELLLVLFRAHSSSESVPSDSCEGDWRLDELPASFSTAILACSACIMLFFSVSSYRNNYISKQDGRPHLIYVIHMYVIVRLMYISMCTYTSIHDIVTLLVRSTTIIRYLVKVNPQHN